MMHQRRMRELLQSFADGELSAAEESWVEHHLASCGDCAASLRCLQESDRLFSVARPEPAALSPAASRDLFDRVMAEVQGPRAASRPNGQPFGWAFGAALAVTAGAALAWWGMAGVDSGGGASTTSLPRPPAGVLVADTGRNTGAAPDAHKGNRASRESHGSGTVAGTGATTKQKKDPPAPAAPRVKAPADGMQPRRVSPFRYRYVADNRPRSGGAGAREHERGIGTEAPGGTELVSGPLPESFVDPVEANGGAPPATGRLLVLVSAERAPSPITVTCAPAETPGFARASGVRPDGGGGWLWTEATVQNECAGPERSLVILGSGAWPWEEEQDDQVWGEPDHDVGDSGDPAGTVGEPARDPGSGGVSDENEDGARGAGQPACDDDSAGPGDIDCNRC